MRYIYILLLLVIPFFAMEQEKNLTKTRSNSVIISIKTHPIAGKLVSKALNGNTDSYVIDLIGKALDKDREPYFYKDIKEVRNELKYS